MQFKKLAWNFLNFQLKINHTVEGVVHPPAVGRLTKLSREVTGIFVGLLCSQDTSSLIYSKTVLLTSILQVSLKSRLTL